MSAGLEEVVATEISAPEIGGFDVRPGKAGVSFRCPSGPCSCERETTQKDCQFADVLVLQYLRQPQSGKNDMNLLFQGSLSGSWLQGKSLAPSSHQARSRSIFALSPLACFNSCTLTPSLLLTVGSRTHL